MNQAVILFDPWPRTGPLIFTPELRQRFEALGRIVTVADGEKGPLPPEIVEAALPEVIAIVGQTDLPADRLDRASSLKAVINVEGNFLQNIDYAACFARGVQVLGVAPAFALPVAEMALGLALSLARGIVPGDRSMREGREQYGLAGNRESFLLTGATIGLIGCGQLGRALLPLLSPFHPRLLIHDTWLSVGAIRELHAESVSLDCVLSEARAIFVFAGVTAENRGFLSRAKLELIRLDAVFLLMSRADVVDFEALVDLVEAGRFRGAVDVFPIEPVPAEARVRRVDNLLLSAHRAGGIPQAFSRMGEMVLEDLALILAGLPPVRLQAARPETACRWRNAPGRIYEPGTRL